MKYILISVFVLFSYWYSVMSISIEYMRKGNKYGWKMVIAQLKQEQPKYDSLKALANHYWDKSDNTRRWLPGFARP